MNAAEMLKRIEELRLEYEFDYIYIGIRFEDKERKVGEIITDRSRSNPKRDNERDFPEYGTEEYDNMDELDGICAYNTLSTIGWDPVPQRSRIEEITDITTQYLVDHCYILGSNRVNFGVEDDNEIIMADAVVLEVLF